MTVGGHSQNMDDPSSTQPINQAGHHTHQTTTCVHMPHTSQPNAACVRTVSTGTPVYQQTPKRTIGGERMFKRSGPRTDTPYRTGADPSTRLMKLSGAQRRPIMKEREKLRVARVDSDKPKRSRANDLINKYCWGTIGAEKPKPLERKPARSKGRRISTPTKI